MRTLVGWDVSKVRNMDGNVSDDVPFLLLINRSGIGMWGMRTNHAGSMEHV